MRIVAAVLLLMATPIVAAEPIVLLDVPYAEPKNERHLLDIYAPKDAKNAPIVVWIHGGGWKAGSKASEKKKSQLLVEKGYVFVAMNYRFVPDVTVQEMAGDIAKAIHYVHHHADEFGGDRNSIIVMGHSAGAQLAALVCTDERYLKAEGLSLAILKGCVTIDSSFFDIPKRIIDGGETSIELIHEVFTRDEATQRDLSATTYIAAEKSIPPFLILHVAERSDTKAQGQWLAEKLTAAKVSATVVAAAGKTLSSINAELGLVDDSTTKAWFQFLEDLSP